jgi:peptidoglycan/LPS O-acetylase OafA/YrhL
MINNTHYREDIVGLRGLAVLAVIIFHANQGLALGGFIGVDIFFVLSGFLIAQSIKMNESVSGHAILSFLEKRLFRILPASLTILAIVGIVSTWVLLPEEKIELKYGIFSFLNLINNIWAPNSISYFETDIYSKPIIHYWTLSVVLQFNIAFGIILSLLLKTKSRVLPIIVSFFIFGSSLVYAILNIGESPNTGYFSTLMRLWEFSLGVILSLSNVESKINKINLNIRNFFVGVGLVTIVVSFHLFNKDSLVPGPKALIPCLGTILIIAFGTSNSFFSRCLSLKWLRYLGTISFSLYLVHQPLFAFYRLVLGKNFEVIETVILVLISIFIALVLFLLIEKPLQVRKHNKIWISRLYVMFLFLFLFLFQANHSREIDEYKIPSEVNKFLKYRYENNPRLKECRTNYMQILDSKKACLYGSSNFPKAVLWGDSMADQLITPLANEFNKHKYSILEFSVAGCPPYINKLTKDYCIKNSKAVFNFLIKNNSIKHVILHAYWPHYFNQTQEKNMFEDFIKTLINLGKEIHIIYMPPNMIVDPPLLLARRALIGYGFSRLDISISKQNYETETLLTTKFLDSIVKKYNLNKINISEYFWDPKTLKYSGFNNGKVLYRDNIHLSQYGASTIAGSITDKILKYNKKNF